MTGFLFVLYFEDADRFSLISIISDEKSPVSLMGFLKEKREPSYTVGGNAN